MATQKQIAARKLFAQRAKSGEFKRKVKKNPAKKAHKTVKRRVAAKVIVPLQVPGKPRLKARRKSSAHVGVHLNPVPKSVGFRYRVEFSKTSADGPWTTCATFVHKDVAHEYAKALSSTKRYKAVRILWV